VAAGIASGTAGPGTTVVMELQSTAAGSAYVALIGGNMSQLELTST